MNCKKCGEQVLSSDLHNEGCIYCIGYLEPYQETFLTCFWCGIEHKNLTNGLCSSCFEKFKELNNSERERIIRQSWLRKNN